MKLEETVIQVENLTVGYKSKKQSNPILENINFSIEKGKLVGIIGLNGSGKSSLLRTLAKQQNSLNGTISILGKQSEAYSIKEWSKNVSWVGTENTISHNLLVKDLVALGRQPYTNWLDSHSEEDLESIEKALILTKLTGIKEKECRTLSDGQLQKTYIARTIAQNTPIILLDEPTTHLDINNKVETLKILKELCGEYGKTIVFSSHEIELCLQICDYLIVIDKKEAFLTSPEYLISSKTISSIFNGQNFTFDYRSNTFLLK